MQWNRELPDLDTAVGCVSAISAQQATVALLIRIPNNLYILLLSPFQY